MSLQEFSDGLSDVLRELVELRKENEKSKEEIEFLRKKNEELQMARSICARLDTISKSLDELRRDYGLTTKELVSPRETILDFLKKGVSQDDYDLIEELVAYSYKGVHNALAGYLITNSIVGSKIISPYMNILTFDRFSTDRILKKHGFVVDPCGTYSRGDTLCKIFSFGSGDLFVPDKSYFAHYVRNTFNVDSCAIYDGKKFIHFDVTALTDYAMKKVGVSADLLDKMDSTTRHVYFRPEDPTLQRYKLNSQ